MSIPATQIAARHPPRLPKDFSSLHSASLHNKVVFRLHTPLSASPLLWTGDPSTSGFTSPNLNLALLTPWSYNHTYRDRRGKVDWAEGPYIRQTMVDHILGKHRQSCINLPSSTNPTTNTINPNLNLDPNLRPDADPRFTPVPTTMEERLEIPEDDKSPWISTSRNLTWIIYEISRRLALHKHENNNLDTTIEMAIIKHHSGTVGLTDGKRDVWEVHVDPKGPIGKTVRSGGVGSWVQPGEMSVALKGDYEKARRGCEECGEVLYFGRIFEVNVEENWEWRSDMTLEEIPLELPSQFRKPPKKKKKYNDGSSDVDDPEALHGWLAELIWDPLRDSFWDAERKIGDRARQLGERDVDKIEVSLVDVRDVVDQ